MVVDTTVQEKNITFPTDAKLAKKVIDTCRKIAIKEDISLRQSYSRTTPNLLRQVSQPEISQTKENSCKSNPKNPHNRTRHAS